MIDKTVDRESYQQLKPGFTILYITTTVCICTKSNQRQPLYIFTTGTVYMHYDRPPNLRRKGEKGAVAAAGLQAKTLRCRSRCRITLVEQEGKGNLSGNIRKTSHGCNCRKGMQIHWLINTYLTTQLHTNIMLLRLLMLSHMTISFMTARNKYALQTSKKRGCLRADHATHPVCLKEYDNMDKKLTSSVIFCVKGF